MERVALEAGAVDRGVQEAEVEAAVVAHQYRPFAAVGFQRFTQAAEDFRQRVFFTDRHAQRMVEFDAGELQGRLLDVGARKGLDAEKVRVVRIEEAAFVHGDCGRGDLQQGIGGTVEATGFHIHHHRQVTTKTCGHRMSRAATAALRVLFVV
ncbi:hypothetical protein FQZ97_985040 [compost metagenome]